MIRFMITEFVGGLKKRTKLEQIPSILSKSETKGSITVYRLGDFVDISKGPMISNTSLIGRYEIGGVFELVTSSNGPIHRFQGVSMPTQLRVSHHTNLIELIVIIIINFLSLSLCSRCTHGLLVCLLNVPPNSTKRFYLNSTNPNNNNKPSVNKL